MKKITVLFVAVLMLFTNGTAHQVHAEIDRKTDKTTLTINGFDGGETVTLYKLYKANYEETDAETKDKKINSYELVNGLVDAKDTITLKEKTTTTDAVTVKIEDLAVDTDGKIAASQTVGGETFDLSTITSKVYPDATDSTLKISDLVGKYPFNTEEPKETQINAISAAIAKNTLTTVPKVQITPTTGTPTDSIVVEGTELELEAYAKKTAEAGDLKPAIYDATGIYLVRVEAASDSDTVYNPAIVSVGYKTENGTMSYASAGYNLADTNGYKYDSTSTTLKKSKPDVDKTVKGGMIENDVDEAVVAVDLDGNPLNYTLGQPDSLTYVKKGKGQTDVTDALKLTDEAARTAALAECTTTNVEEALTKKELIHSGSEGTKFTYEVKPTLPSYPVNAVNKTLWFSDTMSTGLDYVESSLEVTIAGATITKKYDATNKTYKFYVNNANGKYTYADTDETAVDDTHPAAVSLLATAKDDGNGFKITFDYDAIPGGKDADLKLNYDAVIKTKEAIVGLKGMPNVVTMIYANKPDEGNTHDVKNTDKPTGNGLKEDEDYEIVYTYELYFKKVDDQGKPLARAIFGVYAAEDIFYQDGENNANGTKLYSKDQLVCTIETDANGIGYTTEVGPGKYYLKEIEAPANYHLNNTKYEVTVNWKTATKKTSVTHETWEYTTTQPTETGYTEQVGWLIGTATSGNFYQLADYPTADWTYDETNHTLTKGNVVIENAYKAYIDPESHVKASSFTEETTENTNNNGWVLLNEPIKNTKTPELPSTGGIGTYLFTIAGVAILALGAFMLIFRRREDSQH